MKDLITLDRIGFPLKKSEQGNFYEEIEKIINITKTFPDDFIFTLTICGRWAPFALR